MSLTSVLVYVRKHIAFILIGIFTILVMAYLGIFVGMSHYCHDLFFRLRGLQAPDNQIALVVIDEKTLEKYGQWPVPRRYYASLLDRLRDADMVGLDILMIEPSADDANLADAISRHGRVVFPVYIARDARIAHSPTRFSPQGAGHIHLEQDIDGVVRSVYHTLYHGRLALPSFSSVIYERFTGKTMKRESIQRSSDGISESSGIVQMDRMDINYYGAQGSFPVFSMADVIDGRYDAGLFRDKIILVGVTAEGLQAGVQTPFGQQRNHTSGVETHAHILGNLLDGRAISVAPDMLVWILSIVLSIFCFWFLIRREGWLGVLGWLLCVTVVFAVSFSFFALWQFWFSPVPFAVLLLFMFFPAYIFRLEEAGKLITEAKNLWEDSFNAIDDPIVVTDANGTPLQMNQAARMMENKDARLFSRVTCACPRDHWSQIGSEKQAPGGALREAVRDEMIDTETDRHFSVKTLPRYDCAARLVGCVQIIEEITSQKKAAREKQRLEANLMQAQKMESIGTLAGGVAHDFNNILMGIQGYVSLLMLNLPPEDERLAKLKKIESQVQSAAHLTRQLLGFARGGQHEVKSTNVNDLLAKSVDVFGRTKKEVSINARYEASIWPVMVDRGQVEQVLLNMFINSWHAMPQGGDLNLETKNVVLSDDDVTVHDVPAGRYVQITVADTGAGMDQTTCMRVFEPFFTTKEPGKGTGLGLASAYGIIKNHSGFIDVHSKVGQGSVFSIYLPATSEQGIEIEPIPEKIHTGRRETILVVDDEPVNVTVMRELLDNLGYRVISAGSGQEAVSIYMVKKDQIDLVILDMIMPGMGGAATFDMLRDINPSVKIILSSGYDINGDARKILERGCNGFIQKPFLMNDLSRKIREIL